MLFQRCYRDLGGKLSVVQLLMTATRDKMGRFETAVEFFKPFEVVKQLIAVKKEKGQIPDDDLVCRALLLYGAYMGTNHFRHRPRPEQEAAADFIAQECCNGAMGHSLSARALDQRWMVPRPPQQLARRVRPRLS